MMRDRQRRWSRRGRRSSVQQAAALPAAHTGTLRDSLLALPSLDRGLSRLLARPRALQVAVAIIGLAIVALTIRPLIWPVSPQPARANATAAGHAPEPVLPTSATPLASGEPDAEVLSVVAAYNQASITAAMLGRADVMARYLAPDGTAWAEVQAEYQRRATRGEAHEPALTRWGVLQSAVTGDTAIIETQEQWDDITSIGGQVISSRRGILTRNTYTLRRAPDPARWLITDVATTTIIN